MWYFAGVALAALCRFALADEPAAADDDAIDPAALVGCRAPDEANCARCCVRTTADERCVVLSGSADWGLYEVEPWYNAAEIQEGACPADCPRCARCSERAERELRALPERPECDCASQSVGIDPCYSPWSCACYCQRRTALMERCPPAANGRSCR